jgi:hypothetical protein
MPNLPAYPKSYRGAMQQIDRLIRRYRRNYAAGGQFGFDWPTMRLNEPELYQRIRDLQKDFARVEGMPR